ELYDFIGEQIDYELDTADDLLKLQFPQEIAPLLGGTDGVAFLNLLPQLSQFGDAFLGGGDAQGEAPAGFDPSQLTALLPSLLECGISATDLLGADVLDTLATGLISCLDTDVLG